MNNSDIFSILSIYTSLLAILIAFSISRFETWRERIYTLKEQRDPGIEGSDSTYKQKLKSQKTTLLEKRPLYALVVPLSFYMLLFVLSIIAISKISCEVDQKEFYIFILIPTLLISIVFAIYACVSLNKGKKDLKGIIFEA